MNKKNKHDSEFFPEGLVDLGTTHVSFRSAWVEESFVNDHDGAHRTGQFINSSFRFSKSIWFFALLLFLGGTLLARVLYIQLYSGDTFRHLAESNRQRIIPIPSERGIIFDRYGVQLTNNVPSFSVTLIPQDLPRNLGERTKIIEQLASLTSQNPSIIEKILHKYGSYSYDSLVVLEDLDYDTALSIHIATADLPGIQIQRGSKRSYQFEPSTTTSTDMVAESLSHIIGYENKVDPEDLALLYEQGYLPSDTIGKTGIEKMYEQVLRGTYGKRRIEVDALGKEQAILEEILPIAGRHITLTIDIEIQRALEDIIRRNLLASGKKSASGIVSDPNSGEILALVSLPTFDNNEFSGGISVTQYQKYIDDPNHPLFQRAISGMYPSGSTIKPALALLALDAGIITAHTSFLSIGGLQVGPWFFPDWLAGGHGRTDVRKSLAWSVNTFYYYIGGGYREYGGLGVEKMMSGLRSLGFANKLGIDLPGESSGFLPSPQWKQETKGEQWYIGDTYNLSIGQGDLLVTPLQINAMTSAFANGGTVYRPFLLDSVKDPVTGDVQPTEAQMVTYYDMPSADIETVRLGMRDCVVYGSCQRLSSIGVPIAGKTGTAQWSNNKETHSWMTTFAPFDKPEIVVTVLVEEAGSTSLAIPITDEFYRWWYRHQ